MSEHAAKLDGLNLVVRNMEATLDFYRCLGVDIPEDSPWRTDNEIGKRFRRGLSQLTRVAW